MEDMFSRTRMLLGDEAMERLARARVAVFGIGGVGGHAVEALARSGIGALDLIDSDRVVLSNLNRQIIATRDTLGMLKVDAAKARVLSINPECEVRTWPIFYLPETADRFDFRQYDYVVDAIDTVAGKLQLIQAAKAAGTPIISCMGAGNKLDPTAFRVADIPGHAPGAEEAGHRAREGGLLHGTGPLPRPHGRAHRSPGYPRQRGLRALGGRADIGRRSHQRYSRCIKPDTVKGAGKSGSFYRLVTQR